MMQSISAGHDSVLSATEILGKLSTADLGRCLEWYSTIDSTNRRALEWAADGAPDGALVIAEEQTAGRGRLGRRREGTKRRCAILFGRQRGRTEHRTELLRLAPQLRDQRVDVELAHRPRFYRSADEPSIARRR